MIKLAKPYIPTKSIDDVVAVLKSGNLIQGQYVDKFEKALQEYLGIEHAIIVNSGTAALHASLLALGVTCGDEVIVPAFTFPATANVVELVGATPVIVDILLEDYCIDSKQISAAITERTKAIIPVHEFGQAADMSKIMQISNRCGIAVIEDAACALGTEFNGRKVGTFGKLGCFSFHPRKAITTGEGGVVVTNNDHCAEAVRAFRNHGILIRQGRQEFVFAGLNYRLTDFQAALGLAQFEELDFLIDQRIEQARLYNRLLKSIFQVKTPATFEERKMVYQTYHVLLDGAVNRDNLINLLKQAGVETNLGAQALNSMVYFQSKYGLKKEDFPKAVEAFTQGLALPLGMHLDEDSITKVVSILDMELQKL